MRVVSATTTSQWLSGDYTGANRCMGRATIQFMNIQNHHVIDGATVQPGQKKQVYSTALFGQLDIPRELPNIKSIERSHSVDQDSATCIITLYNTDRLPLGVSPDGNGDFDRLGYLTFNRGEVLDFATPKNAWHHVIVPDRIIRTFEGFGYDLTQCPEKDPNLYPTGVWSIDDVEYSTDGTIKIICRDLSKILIEEIMYVPVVPFEQYPLSFGKIHTAGYKTEFVPTTNSWHHPSYDRSSTSGSVGITGSVFGHTGAMAFDGLGSTYWLSVGEKYADHANSFEWIQGKFATGTTVQAVRARVWGGPYRVYCSIYSGGKWQGTRIIPYTADTSYGQRNNNADIHYMQATTVDHEGVAEFIFKTPHTGVTKIRLTFHYLYNSHLGSWVFRAGVRNFLYASSATAKVSVPIILGNYQDFYEPVKLLLAYGGFWWPSSAVGPTTAARNYTSDGLYTDNFGTDDPYLKTGKIWGDLMSTGTYGPAPLEPPVWDKKPLMDGINYIRDIVGFLFFVDESGGAIFRQPNIWSIGNYRQGNQASAGYHAGSGNVITIDEKQTLVGMTTRISSRNVRERIFIANLTGKQGALARGYNPFPSGMRRVAGWCVDTQTEIFTDRGWLKYDEVRPGDKTLSLNEETHLSEWQEIKDVAIFEPADRDMVEFKANNFSALTTADHRWPVERYSTKTKTWTHRTVTSENLTGMDRIVRAKRKSDLPVEQLIPDALVELVAWTYTEGSIRSDGAWKRVVIYQSPSVNPAHCARIRLSLDDSFPGLWGERLRKKCVEFTLKAEASRRVCAFLDDNKAPTMDFLNSLTQEQLELFIEISIFADGHERFTSENSQIKTRQFYQNVGPRLDAFLAACALAGIATSYHVRSGPGNWYGSKDIATVTLLSSQYYSPAQRKSVQLEKRSESLEVWCPTLPRHHNWLARRNGSTYYTSNTDVHFQTTKECQIMADLIGLRSLFTFRTNSLTIVAHPGIQIDDQILIKEHVTGESYYHYVRSLHSINDLETGQWTYDLETNWMGKTPFTDWVFDPASLHAETLAYLRATTLQNITGQSF